MLYNFRTRIICFGTSPFLTVTRNVALRSYGVFHGFTENVDFGYDPPHQQSGEKGCYFFSVLSVMCAYAQ